MGRLRRSWSGRNAASSFTSSYEACVFDSKTLVDNGLALYHNSLPETCPPLHYPVWKCVCLRSLSLVSSQVDPEVSDLLFWLPVTPEYLSL